MGRYTTPTAVLLAIGADPEDLLLLEAATQAVLDAEEWIDQYLGHPFGDTDSQPGQVVTDELANVDGPMVLLDKVPVTSLLEITIRSRDVGADEEILEEFIGYELSDAAHGILRLGYWWRGAQLRISYVTAHDTIPSVVRRAALLLAAAWLIATNPAARTAITESTSVGQMESLTLEGTLRVDYATPRASSSQSAASFGLLSGPVIPDGVLLLLAPYRRKKRFIFA